MLDHEHSSNYGSDNFALNPMLSDSSDAHQSTSAIIGSKIRFKGELVGEEDLVIQGVVDGTIDLKGHNLTVGKDGTVRANVSAKTITIEGKVEGDIFGEEKVTIKQSSNVKGNIVAARVNLEDGAKFKGSIDMDVQDKKPRELAASASKLEPAAEPDTAKKSLPQPEKNKPKLQ